MRSYLADADLVSCELVLTEVPRAVRRAAGLDRRLPLDSLLRRSHELLDALGLVPVDRAVLIAAGAIAEPALRALDAIHVAAALGIGSFDAFVTYDERQGAVARLAGLRTTATGG